MLFTDYFHLSTISVCCSETDPRLPRPVEPRYLFTGNTHINSAILQNLPENIYMVLPLEHKIQENVTIIPEYLYLLPDYIQVVPKYLYLFPDYIQVIQKNLRFYPQKNRFANGEASFFYGKSEYIPDFLIPLHKRL